MPANRIKITATPKGTLSTAFIDSPSKKFDASGKYAADLVVGPDAVFPKTGKTVVETLEELTEYLNEYAAEMIAEKPKYKRFDLRLPIFEQRDSETDEPTGMFVIRAGQSRVIKLKKGGKRIVSIDVFNAKGKPMSGIPIGRGTTARIAGSVVPYVSESNKQIGLTMYLEGCKVIDLVKPGVRGADEYGFGEEEDGFEETEGEGGLTDDEGVGLDDEDNDDDDDGDF